MCAQAATLAGDFAGAAQLVAEADAVVHATGTRVAPYGALVLSGHRGRAAEAFELIHGTIETATAGGQGTAVQYARWAKAVAANGLGRYPEALAAAAAAADDTPELFVSMWALSELVEAGVRTGRTDVAARAFARLCEHTRDGTEWALGIEARSRALVSEADAADGLYREAIERLERTPLRPQLARTHLLYGEWLRREGRRVDAREHLRTANALLVALGMEAFAERARRELLGHRGESSQAHHRDPGRTDRPGARDRPPRARRPDQPGDRRAAVPEPAHRRMAPQEGLHQARDQLADEPARGAAQRGRGRDSVRVKLS